MVSFHVRTPHSSSIVFLSIFREEFDNVAFVYVSDDMDWGRKNLKNRSGDLFFLGSGIVILNACLSKSLLLGV